MTILLVRDLMTVGVPTCKTNTPIIEIARFLIQNNIEEMVVLGNEGEGLDENKICKPERQDRRKGLLRRI